MLITFVVVHFFFHEATILRSSYYVLASRNFPACKNHLGLEACEVGGTLAEKHSPFGPLKQRKKRRGQHGGKNFSASPDGYDDNQTTHSSLHLWPMVPQRRPEWHHNHGESRRYKVSVRLS